MSTSKGKKGKVKKGKGRDLHGYWKGKEREGKGRKGICMGNRKGTERKGYASVLEREGKKPASVQEMEQKVR